MPRFARRALMMLLFVMLAAAPASADSKLADVLARIAQERAAGRVPLAVFDIDGTILDPAARTRDIMTDALQGPGAMVTPEQPQLAEQIRTLPLARYGYEPESTLARAGITDTA